MGQGEWVERARDVRSELKPPVYRVVERLMAEGWSLRRQGHKLRLYCACGGREPGIGVWGSPRDADWHAQQIERKAEHCPDRHALDRH